MKLPEILALHPGADADSATLAGSLATAEARHAEMVARVSTAEGERAELLLNTNEKALTEAEKQALAARLAADRIAAILAQLRLDLAAARGRETVTELEALATSVEQRIAVVRAWQETVYPQLSALIGAGLAAERDAISAYAEFVGRVDAEFARQEVRDAAPGGLRVTAPEGIRPSSLFPTWSLDALNG